MRPHPAAQSSSLLLGSTPHPPSRGQSIGFLPVYGYIFLSSVFWLESQVYVDINVDLTFEKSSYGPLSGIRNNESSKMAFLATRRCRIKENLNCQLLKLIVRNCKVFAASKDIGKVLLLLSQVLYLRREADPLITG